MSYRVKAIVLVALLASGAVAVTAWVSARSTVAQLSSSVDSQQADVDLIANKITEYGIVHGSWTGVARLAVSLERETSQRIKLTTQSGKVVADTDRLEGRTPRATSGRSPVAIVPRPSLELPSLDIKTAIVTTRRAMDNYRTYVRVAACLTGAGIPIAATTGRYGLAEGRYDPALAERAGCSAYQSDPSEVNGDQAAVERCEIHIQPSPSPAAGRAPYVVEASPAVAPSGGPWTLAPGYSLCLSQAFQQRIAADGAETLLLYLGVQGAPTLRVNSLRVLAAAVPIVLLAIVCAALLSRQVLRPVDAVIDASRRLEAGHRTARVPERGRDEMASLARAFNRMADAVADSEDQQRQMVADIAHELRSPLANIRGYLEALKDGVLAPDTEIFESLHEEALLQQRTIDDLQDLALADQRKLIAYRTRSDLGELVHTTRAAHAARAEAAGLALSEEVEPGLFVDADPDRLRQAIGNLLTNALRATPPGGRITVTARRVDPAHAGVEVADTGHGILPEHLGHIFDRFWRADPARSRGSGSGLGLAIVREIVHAHGGRIEVASTPENGTTFTITLPTAAS